MAEYYAVLKKAVGGLDAGSAEARRAVYDKARNALIGQLKAIDPPLPASEISRQRLELEEAIRRVERETVAAAQSLRREKPPERDPAPSVAPDPVPTPAPEQPSQSSAQDVFRRAIQEAEARGASDYPAERAPAPVAGRYDESDAIVDPPGDWAQGGRPQYQAESSQGIARLAPDFDNDRQPRGPAPDRPPEPRTDRRERQRSIERDPPDLYDDDDLGPSEKPARRSRLPMILLLILILGMIGGLGALAWSQRTVIADLMAGFDGGSTDVATPVAAPPPPDVSGNKSEDRLGGSSAGDSSVRVIGGSDNGNIPAIPNASADPIANAIADTPAPSGGSTGQTALLYEEPLDAATAAAGVTAINAVLTWKFVEGDAANAAIEANLEVPERGLNIRLVIRRNTDQSLPASHLVETIVETTDSFPGKGIRSVPRLVLKQDEDDRGEPLIGAAAKVADGFFWIALSAAEADVTRNLNLLRERSWIDLPMVYETGQRAILTFEKGPQGTNVFENAFAAWNAG